MTLDDRGLFDTIDVSENYRVYLQPYLFDPWAEKLVRFIDPQPGQTVLDVAAGTGAVSRAAASAVGPTGSVIASDISEAMLSSVAQPADDRSAAITTLQSSATALNLPDESVDVVLCQQGFPFMPDRAAVAREMYRVLRPGGSVGIAVWTKGVRLDPFDNYAEFMTTAAPDAPFLRTMADGSISMVPDEVADALTAGGFPKVAATNTQLTVRWPSVLDEARGIAGTPFGLGIAALKPDQRDKLIASLAEAIGDTKGAPQPHLMTSVFALGIKQ
jgi:ubiquinone/menaquinone biosynthesis C-methylase UbiE